MKAGRSAILVLANAALFVLAANWFIAQKEDHLANGARVLLEITFYDPRSLMQGDYLSIVYPICREIDGLPGIDGRSEGHVVIRVRENRVAELVRLHDGAPLAPGELLLHYRMRHGHVDRARVAATSFFFEEGRVEDFRDARYAELRVDADGRTLLVALCDADGERIGGD